MTTPTKREVSAGIVVFRKTREGPKFLVLYHGHNYWNFPKGHIENEEKSLEAALRETKEETGLHSRDVRLIRGFKAYERFHYRRAGNTIFKIVIFYLAETRNPIVRVSEEHQGYGWFLYREAQGILGKYRDSQKVLREAYAFLRKKRQPRVLPESHGHRAGDERRKKTDSKQPNLPKEAAPAPAP